MEDYKWFFDDPSNEKALKAELDSWKGTPYKHRTGVKKRGCDCIHLVLGTFKAVGADKGRLIHVPKYSPDWHLHRGENLLFKGFINQFDCEEVYMDPANLRNGDVILFKWGKYPAHAGIYWNGSVYQALTGLRVETRQLRDLDFYNRMEHILRVTI